METFKNFREKTKNEKLKSLKVSLPKQFKRGDTLGFLKPQFAVKYHKIEWGPFGDKKNREKETQCRNKFKGGTL